jgi:hypothetical protein
MTEKHLLEALDCCRPGSGDLACADMADAARQVSEDPQLRHLQSRIEQFDLRVRDAFADVEVPAGLAERLVAGVQAEAVALPVREDSPHVGRRWAVAVSMMVAASALIAVTAYWWGSGDTTLSFADLELQVSDWEMIAWGDSEGWNRSAAAAPESHPKSDRVLPVVRRWKTIATPLDRRAVAYDLSPPGGRFKATLYVVRTETQVPGLGVTPPLKPQSASGRSLAAWESGDGLLYVLVVEGPERRYRDLVDIRTGPLI